MSLIQEIALELTIQTGQVYTCPDDKTIIGPDRIYSIHEDWQNRKMLHIAEMGPLAARYRTGNSIRCNSQRTPEAIARDIRNRLPNAAAHFAKVTEEHRQQLEKEARFASNKQAFTDAGLKDWSRSDQAALESDFGKYKRLTVKFTEYSPEEIDLSITRITPDQALKIAQFIKDTLTGL